MSNLKNIQRRISEGVSGWLLFEFNCERGYLFNEKYLSYAMGQILHSVEQYKTRAEINHPCGNPGRGRPLQVDFVLMNETNDWAYAFESKWVGNTAITLGSMIWDLIRLQNLFHSYPKVRCYFILSGFEKKIKLLLSDLTIFCSTNYKTSDSITKENPAFFIFDLFKLDADTKDYINKMKTKYPGMILFSKIRCRPAHRFPKEDLVNMSFSTYTFEILAPDKTLKIRQL